MSSLYQNVLSLQNIFPKMCPVLRKTLAHTKTYIRTLRGAGVDFVFLLFKSSLTCTYKTHSENTFTHTHTHSLHTWERKFTLSVKLAMWQTSTSSRDKIRINFSPLSETVFFLCTTWLWTKRGSWVTGNASSTHVMIKVSYVFSFKCNWSHSHEVWSSNCDKITC